MCRDTDKFPVNFSGVPHIGQKIFGFLDFKDLDNCRTVCKGWLNFLGEKRYLWIELLEKEKIKLESLEYFDSDDFSDCSDDSLDSVDIQDIQRAHYDDNHDSDFDPMEILEECDECVDEKDERLKKRREDFRMEELKAGWYWLIEKVKNGPVSDIICLIPKIRHVDLFGDIFEANHVTEFQQDYLSVFKLMIKHDALLRGGKPEFLRKAIQAKNVEMVKFLGTEIHRKHEFSANVSLPKYIKELAEKSYNKEILKYLNLLT